MKFEISAGGIIYKKIRDNIFWLVTKTSRDNTWVFPKGHVADTIIDEKMEDAALREVEEEAGIKAKIIQKIPEVNEYFFKRENETIKKHTHYYVMEYVSGDTVNHDDEMSEAEFVSEDEALKRLTYPLDKKSFIAATKIIKP